jgi:hypothetical protein
VDIIVDAFPPVVSIKHFYNESTSQLCKVTSFYSRTHAINSKNWLLFECCFTLLVTFVGFMEGERILKSCQTDIRKYENMAHSK